MFSAKRSVMRMMSLGLCALLGIAGCEKKQIKTDGALAGAQDAALKGEDIALEDANLNFVEPSDKVTFANVYFEYDSSNIPNNSKGALAGISQWLNSNTTKHLLIEGHCDERGTKEYNLALGEQRALSVRRYLTGLGIDPKKLHTISYGEERPAAKGHGESDWKQNRRAHFLVSE